MIPADKILCLAHEHDRAPRNPRVPPNFCDLLATCARHQAISRVPFDGTHTAMTRVCQPGKHDAYIPLEGNAADARRKGSVTINGVNAGDLPHRSPTPASSTTNFHHDKE